MAAKPDNLELTSEEALCDHFVDWWANSGGQGVEAFLERLADETPRSPSLLLKLIAREIELLRRSGRAATIGDYRRRFPELPPERLEDLWNLPERPFPAREQPQVPDRYRLLRQIGQGGIGVIWEVLDRRLNRHSALKTLRDRYSQRPAARLRLQREALLTGSLEHPGIPAIHDRGHLQNGAPFFVMKLVRGQTLDALLVNTPPRERASLALIEIFRQVAQTIAYAHSRGVIHRDLKPQNMMVGEFGEVQIMDWGMAKQLTGDAKAAPPADPLPNSVDMQAGRPPQKESPPAGDSVGQAHDPTLTRHGDVLGTPAYMSPEQARGHHDDLDQRADVFGLGAVLFEILTGHRLYQSVPAANLLTAVAEGRLQEEWRLLQDPTADELGEGPGHLPLRELCRECLSLDPARRPADGQQVADRVQDYLQSVEERLRQAELDRHQAQLLAREERKQRKLTVVLAATVLGAILLAVLAVQWYQYDRQRQEKLSQRQQAKVLVEALETTPAEALPFAIENLRARRNLVLEDLRLALEAPESARRRLNTALALTQLGEPQREILTGYLGSASDADLSYLVQTLAKDPEKAVELVRGQVKSAADPSQRARLAWVLLNLGEVGLAEEMNLPEGDAQLRMEFIKAGKRWQGDLERVLEVVLTRASVMTKYSVLCSIALRDPETLDPEVRQRLTDPLEALWANSPRVQVHAAAEAVLRKWNYKYLELAEKSASMLPDTWDWSVNSLNMVLARIPVEGGRRGESIDTPTYEIEVADREVTIAQFLQFLEDDLESANRTYDRDPELTFRDYFKSEMRIFQIRPKPHTLPANRQPVACISFYDAVRFCNWLSQREGLAPYYINRSSDAQKKQFSQVNQDETWESNPHSNGYRLPNQREYGAMALGGEWFSSKKSTVFYMEPDDQLEFEWTLRNTTYVQAGAIRLPNRLGLFDVMGNLEEVGDLVPDFQDRGLPMIRHALLGHSFKSPRLDSSYSMAAVPMPSRNVIEDRGFRVMKCSVANSRLREQVALLGRMRACRSVATDTSKSLRLRLPAGMRANSIGLQLSDLGLHSFSLEAYEIAQDLFTQVIKADVQDPLGRRMRGGVMVNSAISLLSLDRLEEAQERLELAREDLQQALRKTPQESNALRFLDNANFVMARVRVRQIQKLVEAPGSDPVPWESLRDELQELHLALGKSSFVAATLLAGAQAQTGQFEQAIETQQQAQRLARTPQEKRSSEEALKRFRQQQATGLQAP